MIIKSTIINNTFDVLKINDIYRNIIDNDKISTSDKQKITETSYSRYIKIIKPFQEISYLNVIDPLVDEYNGFIYFNEKIYFDNSRFENISVTTPIEASFKNKYLLSYLIERCLLYVNKYTIDNYPLDYYLEFILDLEDIDIYKQIIEYYNNIGIRNIKIENVRFYDNMNGYFLSSYLFKDPNHIRICSKMNDDFPGSIKCDHLYRKLPLKGDFLNFILNRNGNILKLYKSNNLYKIYGKLTYLGINYLYNYLVDYYNKYMKNLLKDDKIMKLIEDGDREKLKQEIEDKIDRIILPYFQIPIGFDAILSFYAGTKKIINLKLQTQVLFDLFDDSFKDDIIDNFSFNFKRDKYSIYPKYYYNYSYDNTINNIIQCSLIINEVSNNGYNDITLSDISGSGEMAISILDSKNNIIFTPYFERLYNNDFASNRIFNFNLKIDYSNFIFDLSEDVNINFIIDNTNFNDKISLFFKKETKVGKLVLNDIFSFKGNNLIFGKPIGISFNIENIHKDTSCELLGIDVSIKTKYLLSLEEIPKKCYIVLDNNKNKIIYNDIVNSIAYIYFNDSIFEYIKDGIYIYLRFKYKNQIGEIKYTNNIYLQYNNIIIPEISDNQDGISMIPKGRYFEYPLTLDIRGLVVKNIYIYNDMNNPEKIEIGKNIFISKEYFPVVQGENNIIYVGFKINTEGKYKIKIMYEIDGHQQNIITRDVQFECIDVYKDILEFNNSFFVDNGIYHISLNYFEEKSEKIIINNISNIPIKIKGYDIIIPRSSLDIANKQNILASIRYTNMDHDINKIGYYDSTPGDKLLFVIDAKSLDFGYNMLFIKIDVDFFGEVYLPISVFTNHNINKNVYVVQYDSKIKNLISVKGVKNNIKFNFKNYGSDSGIIGTYKLGYSRDNIDVGEYSIIEPYSIKSINVNHIPANYGREYGYIYNEILNQIEAFKLYEDDYTTVYKLHNPGILYSFIADVLLDRGILTQNNVTFEYTKSDIVIELKNIGINPVRINNIYFSDDNMIYKYKLTNEIIFDKQYLFIDLLDYINNLDVTVEYIDLNKLNTYNTIIKISGEYTLKREGLCISKTKFDFGNIKVNQIIEDRLVLYNNSNKSILVECNYNGDFDIKTFDHFNIRLRPYKMIKIPISIFSSKVGKIEGEITINNDKIIKITAISSLEDYVDII